MSEETSLQVQTAHPDEIIRTLISPSTALTAPVETALLGTCMAELGGLQPGDVDIRKVQYRLIETLFDTLIARIRNGLREESRTAVRFMMEIIGERLLAVLATEQQFKEQEALRIKKGPARNWRERVSWAIPYEIPERREAGTIEYVMHRIRQKAELLAAALKESFLMEADVPPELKTVLAIKETLTELLKQFDKIIFNESFLVGVMNDSKIQLEALSATLNGNFPELKQLLDRIIKNIEKNYAQAAKMPTNEYWLRPILASFENGLRITLKQSFNPAVARILEPYTRERLGRYLSAQ